MADVFSAEKRSEVMSRICGRNTAPELIVRRLLWADGYRYRVNARVEGFKPDLVFPSCHLAVFVDGCFWHGCPTHYSPPVGNSTFWRAKLAENTARDRRQTDVLLAAEWQVCRVWECVIESNPERVIERIIAAIKGKRFRRPKHWRVIFVEKNKNGQPMLHLERINGSEQRILCRPWRDNGRFITKGKINLPESESALLSARRVKP
jgi:DNA mismatch endonuclease, patch repair protein